jgi:tetratricopeptide (TPR) repeat protein
VTPHSTASADRPRYGLVVRRTPFPDENQLVESRELDRMLDPRTELVTSGGTAGDLIQAAETGRMIPNAIVPQPLATATQDPLRAYGDLAVVVSSAKDAVKKEDREQLFEMLFAPTSAHWDPFIHQLDFARTLAAEVVQDLDVHISKQLAKNVAVVEGAAATGKTVLLKRVALDLAAKGHVVLWLRPYFYPDASARIALLFRSLAKLQQRGVCIIQDDPHGLGSLNLKELGAAARANDVAVKFLVGVRSSEWSTREPADLLGPLKLINAYHLSDSLDEAEWARLEKYLQDLGIARNAAEAHKQLQGISSRSARDTLSMLFWLVPQTRTHIEQSIKQEYFRLGDRAGFQRVVLGQAEQSSDVLKRAYEMVAVADKYRTSVPIEVLVSALGVDYQAWFDATNTAQGAWGLLYAEENAEAETFVYRTRNDVVSHFLIEALNGGGSLSRSGEVRVLRSMLDACTGSHPSYREFCERILAGNEALKELEYADGLDLFERAIGALPYPDKTLLHHKGIWIRKKGKQPLEALKVFDQALKTEVAPYARRAEPDEHIHTSSAAAIIDAMKYGLMSIEAGKEQALSALARSRSNSFFNASAVHVYATLVLELTDRIGVETPDAKHLAANALADVDRTVLVLEATPAREVGEDIAMLRQVRDRIIVKSVDPKEAREQAQSLWESHQNQDGFCLAARAALHAARMSGKGSTYNAAFEYVSECIGAVRTAGATPLAALHDVRLQTLYEWRIHAWRQRPKGGFIHWDQFYDDVIRVLPTTGASPLYRYFEGLALSHLNKWNEAPGAFAQVRQARVPADLLWSRRDMLLDKHGDPRELQGTVRRVNDRMFVKVEELGADFQADREAKWPKPGEITTCFVGFAFGGWTAIPRKP